MKLPSLPVILAYSASAVFVLASAGLNCSYGWQRGGDDLLSSLVWAAVAIACSITLSLSFAAVIASFDRKRADLALLAASAMVVTGAYSISAALGSAAGGRANAASIEHAFSGARERANAAHASALAELGKLAPARPVEEIEALLARENRRSGCRNSMWACPQSRQAVALQAEAGRARRRLKLEARMASASQDLSTAPVARQANSDAAALASFASAVGWSISVDAFNKLLTLLSVLLVECGGGLAISVGMALQVRKEATPTLTPARVAPAPIREQAPSCPVVPLSEPAGAADRGGGSGWAASPPSEATDGARDAAPTRGPRAPALEPGQPVMSGDGPASARFFSYVRAHGGRVVVGQRVLGEKIGVSRSRVCQLLRTHEAAGRIAVRAGARGSEIRLLLN